MMRVVSTEIIDMQGHLSMIHETLKKLTEQVDIKSPDRGSGERDVIAKTRTA